MSLISSLIIIFIISFTPVEPAFWICACVKPPPTSIASAVTVVYLLAIYPKQALVAISPD